MKHVFQLAAFALSLVLGLAACDKDKNNNGYDGLNQVYLSLSGERTFVEEGDVAAVTVEILLTNKMDKDLPLTFALLNDEQGLLKLEGNPVIIPAGTLNGHFTVFSSQKSLLTADTLIRIGLAETPKGMKLNQELLLRVKPNAALKPLTDRQKSLIAGYKTKYGIDLMKWIGVVPCQTRVMSPAGGYTQPFAQAFTKEYKGRTIITLSEHATEDRPILKMADNPLGLTSYMEWVLQQETVFNDEYWFDPNSGPNYKIITELLGWNKQNPGVFTMSLDHIELKDISADGATIECKGTKTLSEEEVISTIPFEYIFTPWELQKKLIAAGNAQAKELEDADGTANPAHYLMTWSVDEPDDLEGTFIAPQGRLDAKSGKLTFEFSLSHAMAGDYTRVYVSYER